MYNSGRQIGHQNESDSFILRTERSIETVGLRGLLISRIYEYENTTSRKPTRIKLGANQLRTYREEARLYTLFDTLRDDCISGVRIIPANHTDGLNVNSEKE